MPHYTPDEIAALRPRLVRSLLSSVDDPEAAEDVAQDAILQAIEQVQQCHGELWPWLRTIARHRLVDQYRRPQSDSLPEGWDPPGGDDPADALEAVEMLEDLSPQERQAIALVAQQGLTYRHAAATMGCTEGAVRTAMHRARRRVATRLSA